MSEGTRWHFVALIVVLVLLHFLLRVGLGLGVYVPDLLVVALLLAARRMRGGWAAGLGLLLGVLDGSAEYLMGPDAVAFAVLGYLAARSREWLEGDSPLMLVLYLFAGKWLYDALLYLVLLLAAAPGPPSLLLWLSPLAALYAAAAGLLVMAAYRTVA